MILTGETEVLRGKSIPVTLRPPKIPRGLDFVVYDRVNDKFGFRSGDHGVTFLQPQNLPEGTEEKRQELDRIAGNPRTLEHDTYRIHVQSATADNAG
jgi:hypothetical protein